MKTTILATVIAALIITADASAAPRTVHLFGDSIVKGRAFRGYDDPSFLNRVQDTANVLAAANGSDIRYVRDTSPDFNQQDPQLVWLERLSGQISAGDEVVFENAGPHIGYAAAYDAWLTLFVYSARPAQATLTTMFDYNPGAESEYDRKLPDGLSANDATRRVASRLRAGVIDWNRQMDTAHAALEPVGVHVVDQTDGIHPTPFGNVLLALSLLIHDGVTVTNVDPVVGELVAQEQRIVDSYGFAPAYDGAAVRGWVATIARAAALKPAPLPKKKRRG